MLRLRILTALILIPLVIWGIFALPQTYFVLLTTLIIFLAAWEWAPLMGWHTLAKRCFYIGLVAILLLFELLLPMIMTNAQAMNLLFTLSAMSWLGISLYMIAIRNHAVLPVWPRWLIAAFGLLILGTCWEAIIALHLQPKLLIFMLALIWMTDTFAYFGGRLFGKHKMVPAISPNKTLEGLVTGIAVTIVLGSLSYWCFYSLSMTAFLIIVCTVVISVTGDLFESFLKRQNDVKDSGTWLPGHGGILDRIDSLLAAAPIFAGGFLLSNQLLS